MLVLQTVRLAGRPRGWRHGLAPYILTGQTLSLTTLCRHPRHDTQYCSRKLKILNQLSDDFFLITNIFSLICFYGLNFEQSSKGILIFFLCGVTEGYNDDIPLQKWSPEYFQYRFFPTPNNFKRRMPSYIQVWISNIKFL